jgi:hypothetical protein
VSQFSYLPHEKLLTAFESLFKGQAYRHRNQTLGNYVAAHLYEDLLALNRSPKFSARVLAKNRVLNQDVRVQGVQARRGDGAFGEILPSVVAVTPKGFHVGRGPIAQVEIGAETKILAKAMNKQIDRVIGDLKRQVEQFKEAGGDPICVALVGVNHAEQYVGLEGRRKFRTDGKKYRHPIQEASAAIERVLGEAKPHFDEMLFLPFVATNLKPYEFSWVDFTATRNNYAALLLRISREYEKRF